MGQRGRETNRRSNQKSWLWLVLFLMVLAAGALAFPLFVHPDKGDVAGGNPAKPQALPPIQLSVTCVGDVMAHSTQLTAQYDSATDSYDFNNNYIYVKDYISQADLALCNVETTFAGGAPSGYPLFNSPDSMASALRQAGFDVALTSNNHMLDRGFDGMQRTLDVLREAGLATVGSRKEGEPRYAITEVKGLKVGVVAYTYETSGVNGQRSINGSVMSDDSKALINSFAYGRLAEDLTHLKQDIDDAKAQGAQIVIAYLHWGEEYQRTPNEWQQSIAAEVAGYGADIIFASHTHVLQPVEYLYVAGDGTVSHEAPAAEVSGDAAAGQDASDGVSAGEDSQSEAAVKVRKVPVFYSMGNFISNQRAETLNNNRYTEQGMLANVNLTWDQDTQGISEISMDVLPTWVDRYQSGGKQNYYIIPLDNALNGNETLAQSGHLNRAKQALEDVRALVGDEFLSPSCPPAQ